MKGIVLAGGAGTRLYPASIPISKILLPIYDKPMIYYPISTLMLAGIKEILIITNPTDIHNFKKLLGDGSQIGVKFEYAIQHKPKGIAEAFLIAENFIGDDSVALILGDNIFHGHCFGGQLKNVAKENKGATVFAYHVKNPKQFGVVEFDKHKKAISLEEKPSSPKSDYAVVGLYFYDNDVISYAKTLKPSARGELEITDLNKVYLKKDKLSVEILGRGFTWLDTGTFDSLLQAANFVQTIEQTKGEKISCIEEIAINEKFITKEELLKRLNPKMQNEYLEYIKML
ncbi:MAG: glucose-1-phosphate thymidylyltransferase RfbA [Candidatus Gastranaerophilales bacterium]|nr:glucose-1-phosphate thymidylyltransferase RfbA [Candidatus Gastranaerophilales bacterium]